MLQNSRPLCVSPGKTGFTKTRGRFGEATKRPLAEIARLSLRNCRFRGLWSANVAGRRFVVLSGEDSRAWRGRNQLPVGRRSRSLGSSYSLVFLIRLTLSHQRRYFGRCIQACLRKEKLSLLCTAYSRADCIRLFFYSCEPLRATVVTV